MFDKLLDSFGDLEKSGQQIVAFVNDAKTTLAKLQADMTELHAKVDRIEGAHRHIFEWLAEIDEEAATEIAEATAEAAATAAEAAEVATAAAAVVTETAAVETEVEESETVSPENTPAQVPAESPAAEAPATESGTLPETPVPAATTDTAPNEEPTIKRSKRNWI
jgi:peptidoglycan hydrolase CwlO-like protein